MFLRFFRFYLSFFPFLEDEYSVNAALFRLLSNASQAELRGEPFHQKVLVCCLLFLFLFFCMYSSKILYIPLRYALRPSFFTPSPFFFY